MAKRVKIEGGLACPKCFKPMQRYQHPPGWQPAPSKKFGYAYWDRCLPCRHIQLYNAAKMEPVRG